MSTEISNRIQGFSTNLSHLLPAFYINYRNSSATYFSTKLFLPQEQVNRKAKQVWSMGERTTASMQEVRPKKGKTKTISSHPDNHSGVPFKNYLPHFHSSSQTSDHRNTISISRLLRNSCRNGEAGINLYLYACVCIYKKKSDRTPKTS